MGLGEDVSVKKRKVIYDEYTGGFYAESKVESLQRQCDYRARLTDVINKAEDAKYRVACKQVDAEKQIFLMRNEKAIHKHNEALLDHKAHKNVLEKLAKEREVMSKSVNDLYGRYPPDSLRPNLEEQIVSELKEMSPVVKRRREATKLLLKRNAISEVNRTLSTDDMFLELKNVKSRISSPAKRAPSRSPIVDETTKPMPKLILPAITVKKGQHLDKKNLQDQTSSSTNKNSYNNNDASPFPSVFLTDRKSPMR